MKINKDSKVAILWYWVEGKSTLKYLQKLWVRDITILDKNKQEVKWVKSNYWDNYLDNLDEFDYIIKSPWISPYLNNLMNYSDKLTSQIEIFLSNYKWRIIWITGTKWKSTTSTLLYLTLKNAWYNVRLVWNIWTPVLDEIYINWWEKYDYIVYEMSSYMLEWNIPNLYIWYLNNIYDCHLDWHNWKDNYYKSKINILRDSKTKISNIQCKDFIKNIENIKFYWDWTDLIYKDKWFYFKDKLILKDENIKLKWPHNRDNILWILSILLQIKKDKFCSSWVFNRLQNWLKETLENFKWLPHRLEEIWIYKDILFIDDAIATTPESTIWAIKTYEQKIWTLFLWWYDYWYTYEKLIDYIIKYKISNIVLFPKSWEKIFWDLSNYEYNREFKKNIKWLDILFLKTKSMESAVEFGFKNTKPWNICLLSNAAASYWLWNSYTEKWDEFKKYVKLHWNSMI